MRVLQEDCVRILARLGPDNDRMMRLAQMKPILKAFSKVLEDGTVKTIDTALWLTWRMTPDADFCQRLFKNTDLVRT